MVRPTTAGNHLSPFARRALPVVDTLTGAVAHADGRRELWIVLKRGETRRRKVIDQPPLIGLAGKHRDGSGLILSSVTAASPNT